MSVADASDQRVVEKGEGPFDLLVRLGALMGAITAALTAVQGILDVLRSDTIIAALPLLLGLLIVLCLVGAISGLTWLARRSRSAVVGFLATIVLAMVTTILGLALAASALPSLGYQLVVQKVAPRAEIFAEAETPAAVGATAPAPEAPAGVETTASPPASAGESQAVPADSARSALAPEPAAPTASASYTDCSEKAQAEALSPEALEEALLTCMTAR